MRGLSVYEWCLTSLVIRETQKHNKMPLQTYKDAQNVKVTVIVMMAAEKWEHLSTAADHEKCYNHYGETAWQFLKWRSIILPYTCPTLEYKSKRNESSCLHKTFTLIFKMTLLITEKTKHNIPCCENHSATEKYEVLGYTVKEWKLESIMLSKRSHFSRPRIAG